jgi:hypothetical protein
MTTELDCSGCNLCCRVPTRCRHLTAEGLCAIYDERPQFCRDYDCRQTGLPGSKYNAPGNLLPRMNDATDDR